MKRQLWIGGIILLLACSGVSQTCEKRIYCPEHTKWAAFMWIERPEGQCFCVYRHINPVHRLGVKCDQKC